MVTVRERLRRETTTARTRTLNEAGLHRQHWRGVLFRPAEFVHSTILIAIWASSRNTCTLRVMDQRSSVRRKGIYNFFFNLECWRFAQAPDLLFTRHKNRPSAFEDGFTMPPYTIEKINLRRPVSVTAVSQTEGGYFFLGCWHFAWDVRCYCSLHINIVWPSAFNKGFSLAPIVLCPEG